MIIAISGTRGLLGSKLKSILTKKGHTVIDANRPDYDVAESLAMNRLLRNNKIDVFFNCAAYTNVPDAELEKEKAPIYDEAYSTNELALTHLSHLCGEVGTHLVHFSTDFVFSGLKNGSYTEADSTYPVNYYGLTKLRGEQRILKNAKNFGWDKYTIFRIQWLYGQNNKNFFHKILQVAKSGKPVSLVDDEFGSPSSATFISLIMSKVLEKGIDNFKGEIFHLSHVDNCSRYECGKYFLNALGYTDIKPVSNLPMGKVDRPKNSRLDVSKLSNVLGYSLDNWRHDLDFYIEDIKSEQATEALRESK